MYNIDPERVQTHLGGGAVAGSPEVCLGGGALHLHLAWGEGVGFTCASNNLQLSSKDSGFRV